MFASTSINGQGLIELANSKIYQKLEYLNILRVNKDFRSFEYFLLIENKNLKQFM